MKPADNCKYTKYTPNSTITEKEYDKILTNLKNIHNAELTNLRDRCPALNKVIYKQPK